MNLHISPNRLISDIQKEFNKVFPFLKLEFFYNKNQSRSSKSSGKEIIPHNRKIGDEQKTVTDGEIVINDEMKVNELENIFQQKFALSAQVFRKSGNLWLETTIRISLMKINDTVYKNHFFCLLWQRNCGNNIF